MQTLFLRICWVKEMYSFWGASWSQGLFQFDTALSVMLCSLHFAKGLCSITILETCFFRWTDKIQMHTSNIPLNCIQSLQYYWTKHRVVIECTCRPCKLYRTRQCSWSVNVCIYNTDICKLMQRHNLLITLSI